MAYQGCLLCGGEEDRTESMKHVYEKAQHKNNDRQHNVCLTCILPSCNIEKKKQLRIVTAKWDTSKTLRV